ncbi:MAG: LamG-like jellyroll fold domain-containing protein [Candidatus Paceibacterota bacterium]
MNRNIKTKLAFTLIELLVVIAIIGILSALIIIGMSSTTQKANIAKSQIFANSLRNSLMGDMVSEWKLDEGAGDTISDTWGSNNGTKAGATWEAITTNCVYGKCLSFDGDADNINFGNKTDFNLASTSHTISVWFKTSTTTTDHIISRFNGGSPGAGYVIFVSSGKVCFSERADGGDFLARDSALTYNDNSWHFVTYTVDISLKTGRFCIDGTFLPLDTYTGNLINYNNNLYIGGPQVGYYFTGLIDDIRIYDAAMPAFQINEQYYTGLNKLLANRGVETSEYEQRIVELNYNYAEN